MVLLVSRCQCIAARSGLLQRDKPDARLFRQSPAELRRVEPPPHTEKQVAVTSKAETVAAHQKAELEKKVAANLKADRKQADRATAKAAIAAETPEKDTMADARQKADNTEYIAELNSKRGNNGR